MLFEIEASHVINSLSMMNEISIHQTPLSQVHPIQVHSFKCFSKCYKFDVNE